MIREPIATPDGFGYALLFWGTRVRVLFSTGARRTYEQADCVLLDNDPQVVERTGNVVRLNFGRGA